MEYITGYILYNLDNEMYLGRCNNTGGDTYRWVETDPLLLCENGLDMLFNISSFIPPSRLPKMKVKEFNDHIKRIRTETKQVLSFLKNYDKLNEIMVVPVDVKEHNQSYDIDFIKAFKLSPNVV